MIESKCMLKVGSSDLSLNEIITVIGIIPLKNSFSKGDLYSRGRWHREHSMFSYGFDVLQEDRLSEQIRELLCVAEANKKAIFKLKKMGCEINIVCYVELYNGMGGVYIDSNLSKRVANLNIGIDLDFYCSDEEAPNNHEEWTGEIKGKVNKIKR